MAIHDAVLDAVQAALQAALIDNIDESDTARATVIKQGPLQGDPDPDSARISVTLHENDPDEYLNGNTGIEGDWSDEVYEVEVGGSTTWRRRFTVKARVLLENTQEELDAARLIASTVRDRIEKALVQLSFSGIDEDGEYVSMPIFHSSMRSETRQGGGPSAYDFHIKVRFEIHTTKGV
jgi:hypothetical protein